MLRLSNKKNNKKLKNNKKQKKKIVLPKSEYLVPVIFIYSDYRFSIS